MTDGMTGAGRGGIGAAADGGLPDALAEMRVGGTPNLSLDSRCCTPPTVASSAALTAPLWVMGLPQSMQNFDAGSFSRPQTAQRMVKACGAGRSGEYMECDCSAGEGAGGVRTRASAC